MLLERATGLAAKIAKYQELTNSADQAEQFQTRANQFGGVAERITRARRALGQFVEAGVPIDFVPTEGAGYAAKAKELRAAINSNPAAINDPPFDLKYEFIDRLNAIVVKANQAMMDGWKAYVAKRADFGSDDVLSALAAVPQFRKSVGKIRECRSDIAALGNSMPSDPQVTVERLDALVGAHNAAWAELSTEDIPKSVISFVRASANEGAPLATYTGEVCTWLESRNLLTAFCIRLR
jgi:hypothetical protein